MPYETCPKCKGKGSVMCDDCQGKGSVVNLFIVTKCQSCDGKGRIPCPLPRCEKGYIRITGK